MHWHWTRLCASWPKNADLSRAFLCLVRLSPIGQDGIARASASVPRIRCRMRHLFLVAAPRQLSASVAGRGRDRQAAALWVAQPIIARARTDLRAARNNVLAQAPPREGREQRRAAEDRPVDAGRDRLREPGQRAHFHAAVLPNSVTMGHVYRALLAELLHCSRMRAFPRSLRGTGSRSANVTFTRSGALADAAGRSCIGWRRRSTSRSTGQQRWPLAPWHTLLLGRDEPVRGPAPPPPSRPVAPTVPPRSRGAPPRQTPITLSRLNYDQQPQGAVARRGSRGGITMPEGCGFERFSTKERRRDHRRRRPRRIDLLNNTVPCTIGSCYTGKFTAGSPMNWASSSRPKL